MDAEHLSNYLFTCLKFVKQWSCATALQAVTRHIGKTRILVVLPAPKLASVFSQDNVSTPIWHTFHGREWWQGACNLQTEAL